MHCALRTEPRSPVAWCANPGLAARPLTAPVRAPPAGSGERGGSEPRPVQVREEHFPGRGGLCVPSKAASRAQGYRVGSVPRAVGKNWG